MGPPASVFDASLRLGEQSARNGPRRSGERTRHGDDVGFYAAIGALQPIVAALAGAGGLALLRWARAERPYSAALIAVDAAVFAIFAFQRNDSLGFWQLPGPWADVFRFNAPGATIGLIVYVSGAIMALIAGFRGLRLIEAFSLIAVSFLFNLLLTV